MFDQFTKFFQLPSNSNLNTSIQDVNLKLQNQFNAYLKNANDFANLEIQNLISLSKVTKPDQFLVELKRATDSRQALITEKSKEGLENIKSFFSDTVKNVQESNDQAVTQVHGAVDAAFASAKQGLGVAESATKSILSKVSSRKKA